MKRVVMIITFDGKDENLAQAAVSTIKMSILESVDRYGLTPPPNRKVIDILTSEV